MPQAIGIVAAAISGAVAFGAKMWWLGALIGAGLSAASQFLLPALMGSASGNANTDVTGANMIDTGLGFDPTPNFSSSEAVIPVVFGKTMVNGQTILRKIYGTNYRKGYFVMAFGEAPLTLNDVYIDGRNIEDFPTFKESVSEEEKEDYTWYVWKSTGSGYDIELNNTGTLDWGSGEGKAYSCAGGYYAGERDNPPSFVPSEDYGTIAGPIVSMYGGGSIAAKLKLYQNKIGLAGYVRFRLENYYNPTEVYYSTNPSYWGWETRIGKYTKMVNSKLSQDDGAGPGWMWFALDPSVDVQGGSVDYAFEVDAYYSGFVGCAGDTTYKIYLDYCLASNAWMADRQKVTLSSVHISDSSTTETIRSWGTSYLVCHLVYNDSIGQQPAISAVVSGRGIESDAGEEYVNPALSTYVMMPGRENPESSQYDITQYVNTNLIDWDSVIETRNFCYSLLNGEGYHFNRAYGAVTEIEKALNEMTAAGRFFIVRRGLKFYFIPDRNDPISYLVSDIDEIIGGTLVCGRTSADYPNRIEGQYVDEDLKYTVQRINVEDTENIDLYGIRVENLDLTGVTDQTQAFELTSYAMKSKKNNTYWCKFQCGYKTVRFFTVGELIQIETTNTIVDPKTWRVTRIDEDSPHIYTVSCAEHNASCYTSKIDEVAENGWQPYSPWYYLPSSVQSPSDWPGPDTGPSDIYNLAIASIVYATGSTLTTSITLTYSYDTNRCSSLDCYYSYTGEEGSWVSFTGPYSFDWPMRYGMLWVQIRTEYEGSYGKYTQIAEYIGGLYDGFDYPNWDEGQFGWQPFGY